jgi:hypothetical protein
VLEVVTVIAEATDFALSAMIDVQVSIPSRWSMLFYGLWQRAKGALENSAHSTL